jgi:hypothetical protein
VQNNSFLVSEINGYEWLTVIIRPSIPNVAVHFHSKCPCLHLNGTTWFLPAVKRYIYWHIAARLPDNFPLHVTSIFTMKASSLCIISGERYDVVLNANQNPGTYWIHMRGLEECSAPERELYQLAVLRYIGTNQERYDVPSYNDGFDRGGTVS